MQNAHGTLIDHRRRERVEVLREREGRDIQPKIADGIFITERRDKANAEQSQERRGDQTVSANGF
jgi:hypothetical protein